MNENRVTPDLIQSMIKDVRYLNDGTTTICIVELHSGWKEIGTSDCVDPANFDAEIGKRLALARATDALYKLAGFSMKERLSKN